MHFQFITAEVYKISMQIFLPSFLNVETEPKAS